MELIYSYKNVDIKPKQTRTRAQHQGFIALCFDYRTVKTNPNTLYWCADKCVEAHVHSLSSVSLLSLTFAYAIQPRTSTYKEKQMQLRAFGPLSIFLTAISLEEWVQSQRLNKCSSIFGDSYSIINIEQSIPCTAHDLVQGFLCRHCLGSILFFPSANTSFQLLTLLSMHFYLDVLKM